MIQATLLVELIVLVCIAAYFGLCRTGDVLCIPLIGQGGRSLLVIPPEWKNKHLFESTEEYSKQLRRYNLHVALVLEDASEWNQWAPAMDTILLERNLVERYPCLFGRIETELVLDGALSNKAYVADNLSNETEYRVSSSTIKTWLTSSRRKHFDDSRLDVLLYVPEQSKSPLVLKLGHDMHPATALTNDQVLLTMVARQRTVDDKLSAVKDALAYADPFLKEQCQLSSDATKWWQQVVHDTYERAKAKVLINHELFTKSSLKVPITQEVAMN